MKIQKNMKSATINEEQIKNLVETCYNNLDSQSVKVESTLEEIGKEDIVAIDMADEDLYE